MLLKKILSFLSEIIITRNNFNKIFIYFGKGSVGNTGNTMMYFFCSYLVFICIKHLGLF